MGKIQVRHLDKVGVLAFCFQVFAGVNWNVQELESVVFRERLAQVANVNFEGDVSRAQEVKESLMANPDVLSVTF